jgi:hypothetical protein
MVERDRAVADHEAGLLHLRGCVGGVLRGHTGADCRSWMAGVGFRHSYVEPLVGADAMIVGIK